MPTTGRTAITTTQAMRDEGSRWGRMIARAITANSISPSAT